MIRTYGYFSCKSIESAFALSIDSQPLHLSHAAGMHECPDPGPQKRRSSRFYTQEKRSEIPKCPQITALPPWGPPGRTSGRRYGFQLQLAAMTGQLQIVRGAARRGQDAALAGLGSAAWQVSPCARLSVRAVLRSRISECSKVVRADSDASRCTHRVQLFQWACRLVSEVFSRLLSQIAGFEDPEVFLLIRTYEYFSCESIESAIRAFDRLAVAPSLSYRWHA